MMKAIVTHMRHNTAHLVWLHPCLAPQPKSEAFTLATLDATPEHAQVILERWARARTPEQRA